ncbi:NADPH-dependent glutamate synthase [Oceanidesulfovibrio marinus]|uniref:Glutamate synthase (NADPH), homotetrameric n=1 Tax=Oceanidesulfovibrio marinus TaxID=370038 RepID=A0A6P1ZBI1_9BACT|nr:NADPH-dependent glutamate synthase [Oceanidesulfovibrio marinus]QJT10933.1 NADPH-dependent glutamate synthase [Oceanidesulfovibrio marinus]TVM30846.1 glutamate synthase (NADPH), homotetrameric [Oceanidesulfovibrio marinus]
MANSEETPRKTKKPAAPRVDMPTQPPQERITNFMEVALGYTQEQAMAEAARCLQCKKPACVKGCPVEVPIKDFIGFLQKGDVPGAYEAIKSTNSLPAVCGRVCPQEVQCEGACILGKKGEPVAIGRLERYTADTYMAQTACDHMVGVTKVCAPIHEDIKVACIGSGPSSLTCAGYLSSHGIKVTVFEALHELGGVLVYGIPEFRLPKDIVHQEVDALREQEVDFFTNWIGGKTFGISELFEAGYKAVFLGVGAGLPKFLNLPGENLIGVFSANEYLTRVNLGRAYKFPETDTPTYAGKNVAVFGGGNVAMDSARTAKRLGAENVFIVYRRTKGEMPARVEELDHAIEEGVELQILSSPIEFKGDDQGVLTSVALQRMELGEPDASGRRRPIPIEGDYFELACDMAIIAVGTGPNPILLEATPELEKTPRGYVQVDEETGETSMPNVFAGGDIVTGAATVISAMGAGRRAAQEIARRLLGEENA